MGKEIIRLEGIKKSYGQSEVLKGIDLSVNESEVVVWGPAAPARVRCCAVSTSLLFRPKAMCGSAVRS